jgi:hypothetical protein
VHSFLNDSPVESGLGGKVFEHERFTDAQPLRDLTGGGPAKPLLREKTPGPLQDLFPATFGRHALFHFFLFLPNILVIAY